MVSQFIWKYMLLSHKKDLLFNFYYLVGFRPAILVTLAKVHFVFTAVRIRFYTSLLILGPGAQQMTAENIIMLRFSISDALRNSCPSRF